MNQVAPPLEELNDTELLELLRRDTDLRLRRSVPRERIIHLITSGEKPLETEVAHTALTRKRLQGWILSNWVGIESQLPCKGMTRGHCTIHHCPDTRHLDCYLAVEKRIL